MENPGRLTAFTGLVHWTLMPARGDEADVADGAGDEVADTGRAAAAACCGAAEGAGLLLFGRLAEAVATAFWNRGLSRLGPRPEPNSSGSPVC